MERKKHVYECWRSWIFLCGPHDRFVHDSKHSKGYDPASVYMSFGPFLFFFLKDWQRKQLIAAKTPSKELEELLPALARHLDLQHGEFPPASCVLWVSVGSKRAICRGTVVTHYLCVFGFFNYTFYPF